jgi:uncharacterized membrane protein YphA (DoxX/SURF4 family)
MNVLLATRRSWARLACTAARLVLGGVWVWAGLAKFGDPDAAVRATRAYQILPEAFVKPFAWGLPLVEIALGILLIAGLASRATAAVSGLILLVFIAGIASVWARGLQIDCGCFGGGGFSSHVDGWQYLSEIARDALLFGMAGFVALGPRSRYALDNLAGR